MIKSFADKKTRACFEGERVRSFEAFLDQALRRLDALVVAETLRELQARPGNRFEALGGDRAGQYSVRINPQWRICFRWEVREPEAARDLLDQPGDAVDVEIVDYH